jgi:hypothetical protein
MKVEVIMNGTIKLVLIPENEIEKLALEMVGKSDLTPTAINGQTAILNKVLHEGLIIQPKISNTDKV